MVNAFISGSLRLGKSRIRMVASVSTKGGHLGLVL